MNIIRTFNKRMNLLTDKLFTGTNGITNWVKKINLYVTTELKYFFNTHYRLLGSVFVFLWTLFWRIVLGGVPLDDFDMYLTYEDDGKSHRSMDNYHVGNGNEIESCSEWCYTHRYTLMIGGVFLAIALGIYFDIPVPIMPPVLPDIDIDNTQLINVEHTDVSECETGILVSNDTEVPSDEQKKDISNELMFLRLELSSVLSELEELDQEYAKVLYYTNLYYALKNTKLYVTESNKMLAV